MSSNIIWVNKIPYVIVDYVDYNPFTVSTKKRILISVATFFNATFCQHLKTVHRLWDEYSIIKFRLHPNLALPYIFNANIIHFILGINSLATCCESIKNQNGRQNQIYAASMQ